MVGREMELDLALRAWREAGHGKLQALLLCGEPVSASRASYMRCASASAPMGR